MQSEVFEMSAIDQFKEEATGILSEIVMRFSENAEINEGMCSCVCITDEQCCSCLLQ